MSIPSSETATDEEDEQPADQQTLLDVLIPGPPPFRDNDKNTSRILSRKNPCAPS
jgi:hypothetical protein